jgi:hypothetical protein
MLAALAIILTRKNKKRHTLRTANSLRDPSQCMYVKSALLLPYTGNRETQTEFLEWATPRPTERKTAMSNLLLGQQNVHRPLSTLLIEHSLTFFSSFRSELPLVKHLQKVGRCPYVQLPPSSRSLSNGAQNRNFQPSPRPIGRSPTSFSSFIMELPPVKHRIVQQNIRQRPSHPWTYPSFYSSSNGA